MFECVMHVFQGVTNPLGRTVCAFDPEGQIFAAGVESQTIKLYDLRAFDKVTCKTSLILFLAWIATHLHSLYIGNS